MRLTSATTLRALLDQRDMSLGRLARYAGCDKSFISHLTAGRRRSCTPPLAERIAEALEVPLALLFVPVAPDVEVRNDRQLQTVAS
jgi:transcriptional regulator with XRE-family HTH domain